MGKVAILGASRGLGREIAKQWSVCRPLDELLLVSRTGQLGEHKVFNCDFAKESHLSELLLLLNTEKPERLFYIAGGGPYGSYVEKNWKDHQWAMQVSFLTPAFLLHQLLASSWLKQFIVVGSKIAESEPDVNGASYCAAKHALRGLVTTLQLEYPSKDLRLFSPGYFSSGLLPKNASIKIGHKINEVEEVAKNFVSGALDPLHKV